VSASSVSCRPSLSWVTKVGPAVASPVFVDGTIIVSTITGRIFALNLFQKRIKWHSNVISPIVSSPLVHNGILVSATYDSWINGISYVGKNYVLGMSMDDGRELWGYEIEGDVFSSPCIIDDTAIVIGSIKNGVHAIDAYNGNVKWVFETNGEVWSSPSYNGEEIFIGSDDGFVYCFDVDGNLVWKTKLNGRIRTSSPCLSSDEDEGQSSSIFIGTHGGGLFCLDQTTGKTKWSKCISKPVMSSPAVIKDRVFFAASDNKIYCLKVKDGSRLWDYETSDRIWSSPCISQYDSTIFFGSLDSHIYGLDLNSGRQMWKFPTMSMVDSSPGIAAGRMFIVSRDGLLYIFDSAFNPSYIR
jgi:outer membrane protein assembly factor BamB